MVLRELNLCGTRRRGYLDFTLASPIELTFPLRAMEWYAGTPEATNAHLR